MITKERNYNLITKQNKTQSSFEIISIDRHRVKIEP